MIPPCSSIMEGHWRARVRVVQQELNSLLCRFLLGFLFVTLRGTCNLLHPPKHISLTGRGSVCICHAVMTDVAVLFTNYIMYHPAERREM